MPYYSPASATVPLSATATAPKPKTLVRRPARDKTAAPTPASSLSPAKPLHRARVRTFDQPAPRSPHPTRAQTVSDHGKAPPQAVLAAARRNLDQRLRDCPPREDCLHRRAVNNMIVNELAAARYHNALLQEQLRSQGEVQALRDQLAAERCRSAALEDELTTLKAAMAAATSNTAVELVPTRATAKAPVVPSPASAPAAHARAVLAATDANRREEQAELDVVLGSARAALARRPRRLVQAVGAAREVPALGVEARPSSSGSEHSLAETLAEADAGSSAAAPYAAPPAMKTAASLDARMQTMRTRVAAISQRQSS